MVKFYATDEQVKEMAARAVNASLPMGMGFAHYDPGHIFKAEDMKIQAPYPGGSRNVSLDYVQGRMVKLHLKEERGGVWSMGEPSSDYQSWVSTYQSAEDLIKAAGGRLYDVEVF